MDIQLQEYPTTERTVDIQLQEIKMLNNWKLISSNNNKNAEQQENNSEQQEVNIQQQEMYIQQQENKTEQK